VLLQAWRSGTRDENHLAVAGAVTIATASGAAVPAAGFCVAFTVVGAGVSSGSDTEPSTRLAEHHQKNE